jgi:hypothetical protein
MKTSRQPRPAATTRGRRDRIAQHGPAFHLPLPAECRLSDRSRRCGRSLRRSGSGEAACAANARSNRVCVAQHRARADTEVPDVHCCVPCARRRPRRLPQHRCALADGAGVAVLERARAAACATCHALHPQIRCRRHLARTPPPPGALLGAASHIPLRSVAPGYINRRTDSTIWKDLLVRSFF